MSSTKKSIAVSNNSLFLELSSLIEKSRKKAVSQAQSAVTLLFWQIGKRINEEILHNKRPEF